MYNLIQKSLTELLKNLISKEKIVIRWRHPVLHWNSYHKQNKSYPTAVLNQIPITLSIQRCNDFPFSEILFIYSKSIKSHASINTFIYPNALIETHSSSHSILKQNQISSSAEKYKRTTLYIKTKYLPLLLSTSIQHALELNLGTQKKKIPFKQF